MQSLIFYTFLVFIFCVYEQNKTSKDWVIGKIGFNASITVAGKNIILTNSLTLRQSTIAYNTVTTGYKNRITSETYLRSIKPEVNIDNKMYAVSGLNGLKEHGCFFKEWIDALKTDATFFQYDSYEITAIKQAVKWNFKKRWNTASTRPLIDKELILKFIHSSEDLKGVLVKVHCTHKRGIELGGYSLFLSRTISEEVDVIDKDTGKPDDVKFNNEPFFASEWGYGYLEKVKVFLERTGFHLLEHDSPYRDDFCASTHHKYHGSRAVILESLSQHLNAYQAHIVQNYGSGVQAVCYLGSRLYDTEETKVLVVNQIKHYKKYSAILNVDIIHLERPSGGTWDGFMHVNLSLSEKVLGLLFNPTMHKVREKNKLPLYCAGFTDKVSVSEKDLKAEVIKLNRDFSIA